MDVTTQQAVVADRVVTRMGRALTLLISDRINRSSAW